jgi:hypothetical protein
MTLEQLIAHHRSEVRKCFRQNDPEEAWFHARIVVGLRVLSGDIILKGHTDGKKVHAPKIDTIEIN